VVNKVRVGGLVRVAAAAVLAALPLVAHAWGAQGHRVIGRIAQELLDARTQASIRELAGQESLEDLATWMDEERPRLSHQLPGSAQWHYDDLPLCGRPLENCPNGNCASHALPRYRAILADHRSDPTERLMALRIVVHLVGDIHQPLHAADNADHGGNDVDVSMPTSGRGLRHARSHGHGRNLHSFWDVELVRRAADSASNAQFAAELIAEHRRDRSRIESGTFQDWINESNNLARRVAYGHLPGFSCGHSVGDDEPVELPIAYGIEGANLVRERLAVAGFRLAAVLRDALTPP
jgi:hypothetical protein